MPTLESRGGARTRLVGRSAELAQIERLLEQSGQTDHVSVLQIVGESGIGKSKLLSHVIGAAVGDGFMPITGRAAEFDTGEPFGVFLSAVDQRLVELGESPLQIRGEDMEELAVLLPTLAERAQRDGASPPTPPSGVGADRYRLHRAMSALLDALAGERPLLLAIDDLHWADAASIELLLYLLRRPPRSRLLVAITYRSGQLAPKTAAAVQQLRRDLGGLLIELSPLSAEEAMAFLPADMSRAIGQRIYEESGGNPFYLQELVRAARAGLESRSPPGATGLQRVPAAVTAVIASELERLSPRARELVQAAAVVGDPFEAELAAEIVGMDDAEMLAAADELMEHDLLHGEPVAGPFSFRHPIVRRAVYASAGSGWRRDAHARAATVLAARGAPATSRALHIERSARLGDRESAEVLAEAGYASTARAPATAARWFAAALRLLPAEPSEERLGLLLALAASLGSAGSLEEGREAFREVLALLPPDHALRGVAVAGAAIVEHLLGKHDDAQALLLTALSSVEDSSELAATLKLVIADGCFFSADWSGMRYWAQKTMESGEVSEILRVGAAAALALAHYGMGLTEAAIAAASESAAIVDGLPDADWAGALQSICFLGWAEYCVGRPLDAERHMRRALDVAAATGQQHLSAAMLIVQAMSNLALGRLAPATEQAENAIDTSLLSANQLFLTWALTVRCMVEIEAGSPASAVGFGLKAVQAGVESRSPWSSVATLYLAEARLAAGEPEQSRKELLAGQSTPLLPPFPFYAVHAYELLTRAELELGLADAAGRWASQAGELADQLGLPGPNAEARRAEALLKLAAGSFGSAVELARASAAEAERAGQPIQAARSRLLAGVALGRAGQTTAAIAELRGAEEAFAEHSALRYHDLAARELRRLGVRTRGAHRPASSSARRRGVPGGSALESTMGIGALSRRERAVAMLVHRGRANRQIAEELSISVKTVENHLTSIFRRLEISSRAQLATMIERTHDGTG